MARKSKKRDSGKKIDIQFQRDKAGVASQRWDWQNQTGNSFREQIKGGVPFPPLRKSDVFK